MAMAVLPVVDHIQHAGCQITGVQRTGLARFKINLHAVPFGRLADTGFQQWQLIAGAGNVMAAAAVEPMHSRKDIAEFGGNGVQRHVQRVGVLLAERVEVKPVEQRQQVRRHLGVPFGAGSAQPAAGRAGVVNRVALLGRAFGIDAQTKALAGRLWPAARTGPAVRES